MWGQKGICVRGEDMNDVGLERRNVDGAPTDKDESIDFFSLL